MIKRCLSHQQNPPGGAHWLREVDAGRIDRLKDAVQMHTTSDLLDQHRCHSLRSQHLDHAEEVDLDQSHHLVLDLHAGRHAAYEADQLVRLLHAQTAVPVLLPVRRLQRPLKELRRVVESEHVIVILDVVVAQESVELFELRGGAGGED